MQYFESAPKSPKQGASKGAAPPSHYYNYAKDNNPTANSMQYPNLSTNPYQPRRSNPPYNPNTANALPEDQTIEDLDEQGNKSSSFLTILLIGLTVLILLVGATVGGIYLFRRSKKGKTKHKGKSAPIDQPDSGEEVESYDSESQDVPMRAAADETPNYNAMIINQIYFNNYDAPEEIVGYKPQNQLLYNSLELKGIATIFETNGWNKEKGIMSHAINNGLCDYFEDNLREIGPHDLSNAEIVCPKQYKLITYDNEPLVFYVLSDEFVAPHQRGVRLVPQSVIFTTNGKLASLGYAQLVHLSMPLPGEPARPARRRLIASHLPSEQSILQNERLWIQLPNYNGNTFNDWQIAASHAQIMQPNAHSGQGGLAINHGDWIEGAPEMNLRLHIDHPNMPHIHPNTQRQHNIDAQLESCDKETLNKLSFDYLKFKLSVSRRDADELTFNCLYQTRRQQILRAVGSQPFEDAPYHQRRLQMYEGGAARAAAPPLRVREDEEMADDPLREGSGAHGQPYDTGAPDDEIRLNFQWLHKISTQTTCIKQGCHDCRVENLCDTLRANGVSEPIKRRLPESYSEEECDCLEGCGMEFKIIEKGTKLELQKCDIDVYANDFEGRLRFPKYMTHHVDLSFGRLYTVREGEIDTTGVPYWRCGLVFDGSDSFDEPYNYVSQRIDAPQRIEEHEHGDGSQPMYPRRRALVVDQDTSNAWSKDNMFMIIASTIFCIFIGIQSYFLLISP